MIEKVEGNELYFAKVRESAVIPSKKLEDAGYDVYSNFEEDYFVVEPHQTKGVPTGIATAFSSKYYFQVEEKSSFAKMGIKKSGGVIDSGYRGEYFIMTYNTNDKPFVISKKTAEEIGENFVANGKEYKTADVILHPYKKAICQIVLHEIPVMDEKEISYEELCGIKSERGTGAFGSTNK